MEHLSEDFKEDLATTTRTPEQVVVFAAEFASARRHIAMMYDPLHAGLLYMEDKRKLFQHFLELMNQDLKKSLAASTTATTEQVVMLIAE